MNPLVIEELSAGDGSTGGTMRATGRPPGCVTENGGDDISSHRLRDGDSQGSKERERRNAPMISVERDSATEENGE